MLDVPTLLLHGVVDDVNHSDISLGKEAFLKDVHERKLLAGVGHFSQREAPEDVLAALLPFLETT